MDFKMEWKLINKYFAEVLMSDIMSYSALKGVVLGMIFSSESHRGLNFCDVICVRPYCSVAGNIPGHSKQSHQKF